MTTAPTRRETRITSPSNEVFKEFRSLLEPKGIRKAKRFLLSGRKTVEEMVRRRSDRIVSIVANEDMDLTTIFTALEQAKPTIFRLDSTLFKELDIFGTKAPLIVGQTPDIPEWTATDEAQGLEILCALGEPSNLGAMIRSAAAFGASRMILLKEATTPYHPKALRAAAGATFAVRFNRGPSIRDLVNLGDAGNFFALDMQGESLATFSWPKNARLLLGEEGPGLPDLQGARRLKIDMKPGVESLNATVAASLALFTYRQQFPM